MSILDSAEYVFVHEVFVAGENGFVSTSVQIFQAEVEGIRLEYYRGSFSLNGCYIAVYGENSCSCQVKAVGIISAVNKAAEKKSERITITAEVPELLVTG
ncbi:hypothetical protein HYW73_01510 [Candidatus Nomurabacteria bacterium]|nr:hypothetical protein [Candidatus Nomurabacteria bacterium]